MKLTTLEVNKLSIKVATLLGFNRQEAKVLTRASIEAELAGKISHGLNNYFYLKRVIKDLPDVSINLKNQPIKIKKQTPTTIFSRRQK